jgi:hypothetical protein
MKNSFRILILSVPFLIPLFNFSNTGDYLAVVSLLFAILAGFFIAATTSNYLRHQTLVASENAALISIYRIAKVIQPQNHEAVSDAIDKYVIAVLDFDLLDYPEKTRPEFNRLLDAIDAVKHEGQSELFAEMQEQKSTLILINQESYLTAKKIVSPLHWFIIGLLATTLSFLLLTIRDGSLITHIITNILILGVFETLGLIESIDSNLLLAEKLAFTSQQQIFRTLGLLDYYPETAIKNGWVKNPPEKYRIGIYKNYPASREKEIRVI